MKRITLLTLAAGMVLAAAPVRADEPRSGQVTAVSVVSQPGRAEIVINVRGAVDVNDFVMREPTRLVIDVSGATLSDSGTLYDGVNRSGILDDYPHIDGVVPFVQGTGCGMAGKGSEGFAVLERTEWGYANHPNLAGALLVGLGCEVMQIPGLVEDYGLKENEMFRTMTIPWPRCPLKRHFQP